MNLVLLLEMAAEAAPDRVIVGTRERGLTFTQLYEHAAAAAAWLDSVKAERLLYIDEASPTLPVALFGAAWAGVPLVPVSYRLADDRLRSLVAGQAPAVLLHAADASQRTAGIEGVEQLTTDAFIPTVTEHARGSGQPITWDAESAGAAVLLHTSGTTDAPKVAVLRHHNLVSYVIGSVEFLGAGADEATLVSVPPYHIAGIAAILTATFGGRRMVQLPRFSPEGWVTLAQREKVTHAMVVPTMLARILDVLDGDALGLPALRHLSYGGGRMPRPVIERALRLLPHVRFVNAYGLTETSSTITVLGPEDHRAATTSDNPAVVARLSSVGLPLPTVEVSIRDVMGTELEPNAIGEVWVRGDQVAGEYGTASVLNQEGWFATKDAGYLDQDGYLFLEGRVDDVIVRGGENMSPGEIEDALLQHPAIREAVVCGIPDDHWGEVVAAAVVCREQQTLTEDEVRAWVSAKLRSSRAPVIVDIRTELPYTDTGKVLRRVVKPQLAARHQSK